MAIFTPVFNNALPENGGIGDANEQVDAADIGYLGVNDDDTDELHIVSGSDKSGSYPIAASAGYKFLGTSIPSNEGQAFTG